MSFRTAARGDFHKKSCSIQRQSRDAAQVSVKTKIITKKNRFWPQMFHDAVEIISGKEIIVF